MTAWIVVTVVSKSATSWLIETFMTDWSSTITNWAAASATSGNQFFIWDNAIGGEPGSESSGASLRLGKPVPIDRKEDILQFRRM